MKTSKYVMLAVVLTLLFPVAVQVSPHVEGDDGEIVTARYADTDVVVYDKIRGVYGRDYKYDWETNSYEVYDDTPAGVSDSDGKIVLDGRLDERVWKGVDPIDITLEPNSIFGGEVGEVSMRVVNNGTWIFLGFQWEDSAESRQYSPKIRREEGGFFFNESHFYPDHLVVGWWMKEENPTVEPWVMPHYAGTTRGRVPWQDQDPDAKAGLWIYKSHTDDEARNWPLYWYESLHTFKWGRFVGEPLASPYPYLTETFLNSTANYAVSMVTHASGCALPGEDLFSWDVRGTGEWSEGLWTLEIARPFSPHPLNAESGLTMSLAEDQSYYVFLAAFDGNTGEVEDVGSISHWFKVYIEPHQSGLLGIPSYFVVAAGVVMVGGVVLAWRFVGRDDEE